MYDAVVREEHSRTIARQPFTFGGVARFSFAPAGRLGLVAVLFGFLSGAVVSWLAGSCLAPVLDEAVTKLPPTGSIEGGSLRWPEKAGRLLAANTFVSFDIALQDSMAERAPVDFSFQFRTNELAISSVLGTGIITYPAGIDLEMNRTVLAPAWGAWRMPILFGLIPTVALLLLMTWAVLGSVYALIPTFIGALLGRSMGYYRGWKLSVAAQLPGSLMMAFALALYSTGKISLVFVLVMLPAHVVPTLIYLLFSPAFAPKVEAPQENPFDKSERAKGKKKNPFAEK